MIEDLTDILLFTQDQKFAKNIGNFLSNYGYIITIAKSDTEALTYNKKFLAVIIDLKVGKNSAISVAAKNLLTSSIFFIREFGATTDQDILETFKNCTIHSQPIRTIKLLKEINQLRKNKVCYADLIWLYKKHSALWRNRSFYFVAIEDDQETKKEKFFLEFLLGTELIYNSPEFEAAITICLNELVKQLSDFGDKVLPKLRELKQKLAEIDAGKREYPPDINLGLDKKGRLIQKEMTALAEQFSESKVDIKPFEPETQLLLRKKIIICAISWTSLMHFITDPEIKKLIALTCEETGMSLEKKIIFDL